MFENCIFTVWNSENIEFDFTEKSLYFIEKHKQKSCLKGNEYTFKGHNSVQIDFVPFWKGIYS